MDTSLHGPARYTTSPDADHWRGVVSAVGREVAGPLTSAIERIQRLATTGLIDKSSLRVLQLEVERARSASMIAQQLTRFASGSLRQSREHVELASLLRAIMEQRGRQSRGQIVMQPESAQGDIDADPSLCFSLVNTLLDWAQTHSSTRIALDVNIKAAWAPHAYLSCRFDRRPVHESSAEPYERATCELDCLQWQLLAQTATLMGLALSRTVEDANVRVLIELPRPAVPGLEGLSAVELDHGFGPVDSPRQLAGSHVLVVASRREVRLRVSAAIRHLGLVVDIVTSVEDAQRFCEENPPNALIVEGALGGERLQQLRLQIEQLCPDMPFIEIVEEGDAFEMSGFSGSTMGRVGRDAIDSALASVLTFELCRVA